MTEPLPWWPTRFLRALTAIGVLLPAPGRGRVVSLEVGAGRVEAEVRDGRAYQVRIGLTAFGKADWAAITHALAAKASATVLLLSGELPRDVEQIFTAVRLPLFPSSAREVSLDCTCPDAEVPCGHLNAVFAALVARVADDPFTVLALRGRNRETLLEELKNRLISAEPLDPDDRSPTLTEVMDTFFAAWPSPGPGRRGTAARTAYTGRRAPGPGPAVHDHGGRRRRHRTAPVGVPGTRRRPRRLASAGGDDGPAATLSGMTFRSQPLDPASWPDLERVFAGRAYWGDSCWCQRFRRHDQPDNRAALRREVDTVAVPVGLVGYVDDEPVGWTRVQPRALLPGVTGNRAVRRAARGRSGGVVGHVFCRPARAPGSRCRLFPCWAPPSSGPGSTGVRCGRTPGRRRRAGGGPVALRGVHRHGRHVHPGGVHRDRPDVPEAGRSCASGCGHSRVLPGSGAGRPAPYRPGGMLAR